MVVSSEIVYSFSNKMEKWRESNETNEDRSLLVVWVPPLLLLLLVVGKMFFVFATRILNMYFE